MNYAICYFIISPQKLKACDFVDRTSGSGECAQNKND